MKLNIVMLVLSALLFGGCKPSAKGQKSPEPQIQQQEQKETKTMKVQELTAEAFKQKVMDYEKHPQEWVFEGDKPAVIDFYATWCGPCKATAPNVEKLAENYAGKVDVYKVDVDQQQELAALFGIQSIPSILFIPVKGKPQMQIGAMNYAQLENVVRGMLK
jgi:thioredoxin